MGLSHNSSPDDDCLRYGAKRKAQPLIPGSREQLLVLPYGEEVDGIVGAPGEPLEADIAGDVSLETVR